MAYMQWRSTLEVGHAQIDSEHRSLVDVLNRLHAAMKQGKGKDEIEKVLVFLKDYTVGHFKAEEALMMSHRYPGAQMHMAIHADLVKQVSELITDYRAGKTVLTGAVLDFLEAWLVKHIMSEDKLLGEFLRAKGSVA
jgi:hemerythrin-like metal-binding protein